MNIKEITKNKYSGSKKVGGGAFSSVYEVNKQKDNKNKFAAKLYTEDTKYDAIKEIETLINIKNNKSKFEEYSKSINISYSESSLIDLEDYYIEKEENIALVFKKYLCTLEDFNIEFKKYFNKNLPLDIVDNIVNKLFYGLLELEFSGLIHCDLKPDNIMVSFKGYNSLGKVFNDINKININDIISIKIIDFNKIQNISSIFKSTSIQTLYYIAPEIILGNRQYNNSIDLWSIGCIIYELLTSKFLFDIFNYETIDVYSSSSDESSDTESKSDSQDSSDSYGDSSDSDNKFNNLAILHLYNQTIGENKFISGRHVESYYSNGKLLGGYKSAVNAEFLNNIDPKYKYILSRIFIYNYNDRLNIKEYFSYVSK